MVLRTLIRAHFTERPIRTAITVLGVALGVSVSVAIRSANVEVLRSFEAAVNSVAGKATLHVSGGDLGLDERVMIPVRSHPDVLAASPVLSIGAVVASGPAEGRMVHVLALDLLEAGDFKGFEVRTGQERDQALESLLASQAVFLGGGLAEEWSLKVGDSLTLLVATAEYQVVVEGVVHSTDRGRSAWEHLAVMDIAAAQELFGLVGRLDRIDVVTRPGRAVDEVARELRDAVPTEVLVRRSSHRNEQVERMVAAFQLNLTTLSAVGLLVGLFLVYNTVSYAVVQRRREIGILRAIGMGRARVMRLFVAEGALMGLLGGLVGGWLGLFLSRQVVFLMKRSVSELYAPVPAMHSAFGDDLVGILVESGLLGMAVSILGAVGPSLEAGRTQPSRALAPGQYEESQETRAGQLVWVGAVTLALALGFALVGPINGLPLFGYASALCLLLGLSFLTPVCVRGLGGLSGSRRGRQKGATVAGGLGRLAAGQVARSPGRNAVTVSALMVGVGIMVGVGVMIHSFRQTVEHWIDQTIVADLILAPVSWPVGDEGAGQAQRIPLHLADRVMTIPGVGAVDTYRVMEIELRGRPAAVVSRDLQVHADWSRYLLLSGDSRATLERTKAQNGVMLSEVLARRLELDVGDQLTLPTPRGSMTFPVIGVFYDYTTDGGKAVMDRRLFRGIWRDETTTVIPVYLEPGSDLKVVREQIESTVGRQWKLAVISNAEIKEEILAIFERTFTVTYALEFITVIIALLGIINTVLTSVLERQREFATLRAVGASTAQVRRLLLWETSYLGCLGAVMGIVAGLLLSVLLIEVINRQSFGWTIRFALPGGLVFEAMALALGAALAAGYLPALWASRQPVAEGLRYE